MNKTDTSKWEPFPIGSLFSVIKGTRLTKANMRDGNISFIGASATNNGITAHIANNEHIHPENTITITYNGSVGEAFYQDEPFWASDDVNVLYPKFALNKYIALFIIPVLKQAGQKYAFIDKWKKEDMEKDCILLPGAVAKREDSLQPLFLCPEMETAGNNPGICGKIVTKNQTHPLIEACRWLPLFCFVEN